MNNSMKVPPARPVDGNLDNVNFRSDYNIPISKKSYCSKLCSGFGVFFSKMKRRRKSSDFFIEGLDMDSPVYGNADYSPVMKDSNMLSALPPPTQSNSANFNKPSFSHRFEEASFTTKVKKKQFFSNDSGSIDDNRPESELELAGSPHKVINDTNLPPIVEKKTKKRRKKHHKSKTKALDDTEITDISREIETPNEEVKQRKKHKKKRKKKEPTFASLLLKPSYV